MGMKVYLLLLGHVRVGHGRYLLQVPVGVFPEHRPTAAARKNRAGGITPLVLEVVGEGCPCLGRDVDIVSSLSLSLHVPEVLPVVLLQRESQGLRDSHPGFKK